MVPTIHKRLHLWLLLLGCIIPVVFALSTRHVWEDYFITFRSSKNLVQGNGLVYQPGEKVQTFTSPLGVLLPAVAFWISGAKSDDASLWVFRLMSIAFFVGAVGFLARAADRMKLGLYGRWVLFALLLMDPKMVDFTINGMETGILLFFLALTLAELVRPKGPAPVLLGIGYAGLMWTRPDAFIIAGALSAGRLAVAFLDPTLTREERLRWVRAMLGGVGLGALMYLPWMLWAWSYYGSPIPNTIVAKSAYPSTQNWWQRLPFTPLAYLAGGSKMDGLLMPSYFYVGGWYEPLFLVMRIAAVLAGFLWLWPPLGWPGRLASFALLIGSFYLCSIQVYPWYFPPWTLLAYVALAFGVEGLMGRLAGWRRQLLLAGTAALIGVQAFLLVGTSWQLRQQQTIVEEGVRKQVGLWLKANGRPGETVFVEPVGYIGYYSGLKMYDWPGLTSPEVVKTIRSGHTEWPDIVRVLRPTWVVLRPVEFKQRGFQSDENFKNYELMGSWDASEDVDRIGFLPGRNYLHSDDRFLVFIRKDAK
jgi:hypothetical protein